MDFACTADVERVRILKSKIVEQISRAQINEAIHSARAWASREALLVRGSVHTGLAYGANVDLCPFAGDCHRDDALQPWSCRRRPLL